jgi:LysM repeat protein
MNEIKFGPRMAAIFLLGALLLSACQQSVSNVPQVTSTPIAPTGLFVTPLSGQNPMEMIEKFAQGTAAAQTAAAGGGTPTTPQAVAVTETGITPAETGGTGTVIPTGMVLGTSTPIATSQIVGTPVVGTAVTSVATTPVIAGTLPTQGPKFPYCLARRFNVNPAELLSINGLVDGDLYYPNLTLKIPQSSAVFPGDRELNPHPATYTVPSSDTTIYGVACYYGDVDPAVIAAANGISLSSALTAGQKLTIP